MRVLVTGGVKAGKSAYALDHARRHQAVNRFFVATAEALDDEMAERIRRHRAERRSGDGRDVFATIEETVRLDEVFARPRTADRGATDAGTDGAVWVVDCLAMWVNNLLFYKREAEFNTVLTGFIAALPPNCYIVTNETGWGNIPFDPATRLYNRLLAEANRRVATACDQVVLMVAGLPLVVKNAP